MRILSKAVRFLQRPWRIINALNRLPCRRLLPSRLVVCCQFREAFGRSLNLSKPETLNEKLQWLKLYDHQPTYTMMADKARVKQYVADRIGSGHVIPTLGIWPSADTIDFSQLPDTFVLKTTHDSHGVVIVKNKQEQDLTKLRHDLQKRLARNYFYGRREWPYKDVKPQIIAEQYMENGAEGLVDFKIHCFHGEPRFILACSDRYTERGLQEAFFDLDWEKMPVHRPGKSPDAVNFQRPERLTDMLTYARILSQNIPFVRVDFYEVDGKVYFGEMTFFPAGGYKRFVPIEYDAYFGKMLRLDEVRRENVVRRSHQLT